MQINPYLSFDGQCKEAFTFYERVLGGKIEAMFTYGDTPSAEYTPPGMHDRIMHASLTAGGQVLLGGDAPMEYGKPQGFCVSLNVDTPAEAERIFHALAESGTVQMPIGETFWADRFGMLTDRFGIPWMVNCQKPA
jgi:PhnB protein